MSNSLPIQKYFNPDIPGLEALLKQTAPTSEKGFVYYTTNGLNIVVYGAAGLGKTNLALQMAFAAATDSTTPRQVIFFTKDTKSRVLGKRLVETFNFFGKNFKSSQNFKSPEKNRGASSDVWASEWIDKYQGEINKVTKTIPFIYFEEQLVQRLYAVLEEIEIRSEKKKNNRATSLSTKKEEQDTRTMNLARLLNKKKFPSVSEKALPKLIDDILEGVRNILAQRFFAFVDFDEVPTNLNKVDRYAMTHSVYDCMGDLEPGLRPLFRKLKERKWLEKPDSPKPLQLFIVCDSLSAATLEGHLRVQARYENSHHDQQNKPIFLFVMENGLVSKIHG